MIYIILYLVAIVLANLSIAHFGPSVAILNAFVLISLDLTVRDALHEKWHGRRLFLKMLALIAAGSLLSWFLNRDAGRIALASFCAFFAAGTADAVIYHFLYGRRWAIKVNGSNVVSAAVDSLVFPSLAFGFPILWYIVIGQFVAKTVGGVFWSAIIIWWRNRGLRLVGDS